MADAECGLPPGGKMLVRAQPALLTKKTGNMDKTIDYELKRGELVQTLRDMEVGDILRFGIKRLATIRSTVYQGLITERAEGHAWRVEFDLPAKQTIVTRLK